MEARTLRGRDLITLPTPIIPMLGCVLSCSDKRCGDPPGLGQVLYKGVYHGVHAMDCPRHLVVRFILMWGGPWLRGRAGQGALVKEPTVVQEPGLDFAT